MTDERDMEYLTDVERESPIWHKIRARLLRRQAMKRLRNDGRLPEDERRYLIGSLEEIASLLAMGEEPRKAMVPPPPMP